LKVEEWLGQNNTLGIDIWNKKYCNNNESFDEWLDRVSNKNIELKQLIIDKKFLFGGRILSNRGLNKNGEKVTYSNCYVVTPPEDSIESIFNCAGKLARTFSYGGGCGIDISKLAPRGAKVNNTAKETSGAVSFMDLYSMVTGLIGQNGRRGALMISIDCNHPDLEEFIDIKSDLNRVTKANISIKITKEFMEAVKKDEIFDLTFIRKETNEKVVKTVKAKKIFAKIAKMNWDFAEPGFLYWDRIKSWNLLTNTKEFEYAGTNPCAEEPLPAGGSCLLGSINLSEFVKDNKFNFSDFKNTVNVSVRALNEVLDEGLPLHPLQEQKDSVEKWRQIGLGIFGLADLLIKLHIEYGSEESIKLCDEIGHAMINQSLQTSALLAKNEGSYPACNINDIVTTEFFKSNASQEVQFYTNRFGLRNSQLLTIAPTGTLSTMLGVSGGIEPIFANYYERKTESLHGKDVFYKVYTPIVEKYMKENNITDDSQLPNYFINSQNLDYKRRIDMQSTWQKYIDASISSTVNVPNNFSVEDTENLYMYGYDRGLKGVTIYRDGCKRSGILTTTDDKDKKENKGDKTENILKRGDILLVNDDVIGKKRKLITGCGSLHCTAFFDPDTGDLLETYFSKGSSGGCQNFMIGLSRMISLTARLGGDIYTIIDQLNSCGVCPSYAVRTATKHDTSKGSCCPVAIGNALLDMYKEVKNDLGLDELVIKEEIVSKKSKQETKIINPCPQCGEELTFEGGCNTCKSCGWSKCN